MSKEVFSKIAEGLQESIDFTKDKKAFKESVVLLREPFVPNKELIRETVKKRYGEKLDRKNLKLQTFTNMCLELANLSHDPKYKVASMIISDDFREICAVGYNGNYKGGPNTRESLETGKSGFLHAEENALYHLCKDFNLRQNLIMICTHTPCPMCAKRIVNAGIKKVIYVYDYDAMGNETFEIFNNSNVAISKVSDVI